MAYAGDVVVVTADQEWIEEETQKDADLLPYWLFELLTPIKVKATATSMCEGVWFEVESIDNAGVRWHRHGCSQRLQFGKITLDEANDIVVLPWDMVQTTVQDGEEGILYGVKGEFNDVAIVAEIQKRMERLEESATFLGITTDTPEDNGAPLPDNHEAADDEIRNLKDSLSADNDSCSGDLGRRQRRIKKPDGSTVDGYQGLLR